MEKMRKTRAAIRTAFTRNLSSLYKELEKERPDYAELQARLAIVRDKASQLEEMNQKLFEVMADSEADEQELVQETDVADEYRMKYQQAKLAVNNILESTQPAAHTSDGGQVTQVYRDNTRTYKLPKIQLPQFGGELKDWLQFWSLFKHIHEDTNITKEDKFQYLIQAMVKDSRASMLVNSFPPTATNYDKVISSLKARYGREDLLVEVYIREMLKLVLNQSAKSNSTSLSNIYDKLETQLRALESLGVTTDMCAAILYPLVESSLPEDLLRVWQRDARALNAITSKQRLEELMSFLHTEMMSEDRIAMAMSGFGISKEASNQDKYKKKTKTEPKEIATAAGLIATKENKTLRCIFCEQEHDSTSCIKAKKMSYEDRSKIVKEKNACFYCVKTGHSCKYCRYRGKCEWCGKRHVLIMCRGTTSNAPMENKQTKESACTQEQSTLANISFTGEVFLQTLRVKLVHQGKEQVVRAIIDTGSHRSYITDYYAEKMEFEIMGEQLIVHMLFGGAKSSPSTHKGYRVYVKSLDESYSCDFIALNQKSICEKVPSVSKGPWLQELQQDGIKITDINTRNESIGILIGADIAGKLLTGRRKVLKSGIIAFETLLGWTLMGKVDTQTNPKEDTTLTVVSMFTEVENVADLWKLDTLGITDPIVKKSEDVRQTEVKENFWQTIKVNEESRYEVLLPWKEDHLPLTDNKKSAVRRLATTTKKLKTLGLYDAYQEIFDDWLEEGIIEKVPYKEVEKESYYLPHRGVTKENSTTKLRPVFDASARGENTLSLNHCLEKGPNLIELIPKILLRFRRRAVGLTSDIRRAFLQISITPSDRDVLRFLWWSKILSQEIEVYRHRRVIFGASCSPFLLGGTIEYHLERVSQKTENKKEKNFICQLKRSFYVDNCVTSVNSRNEAIEFEITARRIMAEGKFDLRGWEYTGQEENPEWTSVLGLLWNKKRDTLKLTPTTLESQTTHQVTKRHILAAAQRVYDPIGVSAPISLEPKLLLQKLWSCKIGWDDEVPEEVKTDFNNWLQQLHWLKELCIPRWAFGPEGGKISFHIFTDASQEAYAAAVFARTQTLDNVYVQLIQAKSRVTPTIKITIPRLELLAATIGARLWNSIKDTEDYGDAEVLYWSDSTTVLAWIQKNKQWNTFVENRVKEIRLISNPQQWRHVPGSMNPADLPSRGCKAKQLVESRWWEGPAWLKLPEEQWPSSDYNENETEINMETKKSNSNNRIEINASISTIQEAGWYMKNQSKYLRIVRTTAWVRRFLINCRAPQTSKLTGELSVEEFTKAELTVFRLVQEESFNKENEKWLSTLDIYTDENGLLRLRSSITNRIDEYDFRHPILLDPKHALVKKLIEYRHQQLKHAGTQTVMSNLRETFWIRSCRMAVRSVINSCWTCKRHRAKRADAIPGCLPQERIKEAKVFEITGIDYIGPLFIRKNQKAWICLFTCAVYRAVHLELTTSLSTEAFLQVFRRFIARRGKPSIIYTDNGTNFVGTRNLLKKIDWEKIKQFSSCQKISWRLNPPTAAWWGGWWERLVRIVKDLLKRTLKKACLYYEELNTVLCDVEAVINSRPLTYLAEDTTQLKPLTPAMFLQEVTQNNVSDLDKIEVNLNRRMRYCQSLRDELRRRFRSEYLGQLAERKIRGHNVPLKVGDIVLIGSNNRKRLDWPLARITEVYPGKDNIIRVAKVKTTTGELVRPIQHLYPLEMAEETKEENVEEICQDPEDKPEPDPQTFHNPVRTRSGRCVKTPERYRH
ncbi:PREDICTED: uncharacterized protein LOC108773670 [Cyphomyrmex costatus]|uniref:uncharacterized protein LOC108773670 n=1 Tax=Cyphomyrmex costatus TaxID=456900 RepID=UPI0008522B04|nr:PREDICTED: uncharacterized protein LOC108773670 [Cyphomyrmex costatus]